MKSVQIPYDLFIDLAMYHLRGEDDYEEEIRQGLEQKLDAMLNRQLYSRYKTTPNEEEREQARQLPSTKSTALGKRPSPAISP